MTNYNITEYRDSMPETVYHYCSVDTFYKIATTKSLRLTDIQKGNDCKDLNYIFDSFKLWFNNLIPMIQDKKLKNNLELIHQLLLRDMIPYIKYYAVCFSAHGDDSNQWHDYANEGSGISLGINTKIIGNKSHARALQFKKVCYDFEQVISDDDGLRKYLTGEIPVKEVDLQKQDFDLSLLQAFHKFVYTNMCYIRSNYFKNEDEYRLAIISGIFCKLNNDKLFSDPYCNHTSKYDSTLNKAWNEKDLSVSDIKFLCEDSKISSYREVTFNTPFNFINEVYLGPKCKLSKGEVHFFLHSNNIDIPYENIKNSKKTL